MGSIFGKKFVRDDKIEGQGKQFLLMAKKINMQKYEVDRIYEEFLGIEDKPTHLVDIKGMFAKHKRPYTLMASVILQIFDRNKTGLLNLMEFVMVTWCFLSTDEDELARLCFCLFDTHKTNSLDIGEIRYLVHAVWEFKPSKKCLAALKKLEQNADGVVAVAEFILLNRHHKELLRPLRRTRDQMRKKIIFTRYWKQLMWRRQEDFGSQNVFEILNRAEHAYIESSMEYLNLRTDIVPVQFVEQWNCIQRRKVNRGTLHQELPHEIREMIKPHPLNVHTRKTLKTVAKSMAVLSRFRKKSTFRRGSVLAIADKPQMALDHTRDDDDDDDHDDVSGLDHPEEAEDSKEDAFEERDLVRGPPASIKARPFDDSFLGSLKAPR